MYLCLLQNGEDVIRDALVIMSKTGDIYVGVLGTEPSLFSAPRPEARQVNYEETDIEMASLNTIIKTAQTADEGKHTCPRVIIKGGGNFRSSDAGTKVPRGDLIYKIWIKGVEQFPSRSPKAQGGRGSYLPLPPAPLRTYLACAPLILRPD